MRFSDIEGNDALKATLRSMVDSGRIPHAMLFYENEGCGAFPLVMAFLQYLCCHDRHDGDSCAACPSCNKVSKLIHPDIHFVFPTNAGSKVKTEAKNIVSDMYARDFREMALDNPYFLEEDMSRAFGIENKVCDINVAEAKAIIDTLSLAPVEDGYKVMVVFQPEKLNVQAANKLLKVIEEPPEQTLFLFITHNPDKVLQTIFSRCQSVRVMPMSQEQVATVLVRDFNVDESTARSEAGVCGGSVGKALSAIRDSGDSQAWLDLFSDLMDAVLSRDLQAALACSDTMAGIDSREKQKDFCVYASECFRKIFLIQQNLSRIAYVSEYEQELFDRLSRQCPKSFSRRAVEYLDSAVMLLERNVSQKILFYDLVNRLFSSI